MYIHVCIIIYVCRRICYQRTNHTFLVATCRIDVPNADKTALIAPKLWYTYLYIHYYVVKLPLSRTVYTCTCTRTHKLNTRSSLTMLLESALMVVYILCVSYTVQARACQTWWKELIQMVHVYMYMTLLLFYTLATCGNVHCSVHTCTCTNNASTNYVDYMASV